MKVLLVALSLLAARCASGAIIIDPGQGIFDFTGEAAGLSGLTYVGGNDYYAVSDSVGAPYIHPVSIVRNADGTVATASLGAPFALAAGADPEGIAFHPTRGTFFVSDESYPDGSYIREFNRLTGAVVNTLAVPAIMMRDRPSLGFEALTLGAGAIWTANEQALEHESHGANAAEGSLIRLQRFDDQSLAPAGQWVYQTDPSHGAPELVALPDGRLLVLERSFSFGPWGHYNRIYLVDFSNATDTSALGDLDEGGFTTTTKSLLWEAAMGSQGSHNFEGIALGPQLDAESYALLLIADNNTGSQQHVYSLTIRGVPEPGPAVLLALTGTLWLGGRRRLLSARPDNFLQPIDALPAVSYG